MAQSLRRESAQHPHHDITQQRQIDAGRQAIGGGSHRLRDFDKIIIAPLIVSAIGSGVAPKYRVEIAHALRAVVDRHPCEMIKILAAAHGKSAARPQTSEGHTSELQSLM